MGPTTVASVLVTANAASRALAASLARIAADPAQTKQLHETLGSFCHQVRNHLNSLQMGLYLARRGQDGGAEPDFSLTERTCREVEQFVDRLQQVFRPLPIHPARLPLGLLIDDRAKHWPEVLAAVGRRLVVERPTGNPEGEFDPLRLAAALDDLVAWRAWAGDPATDLKVGWGEQGGRLRITWDEPPCAGDRPASPPPAKPASAGSCREACAPLIVPLLARLMTLHGGALDLPEDGPWRLTLSWPIVVKPHQGMAT